MIESELEGTVLANCVQLEVIGAKDCMTMVEAALIKTPFFQEENSSFAESRTLLIQFEVCRFNQFPLYILT